ncbi:MAG: sulfatase [Candidatus Omnitrophica bacterium]|nr:sulfatase [Candidatus Omnitrophota bacterium]
MRKLVCGGVAVFFLALAGMYLFWRLTAPNIVWICIDALRPDHVTCYGYRRATSPHLDALAAEGVRFTTVYAQAGYTLASVPSFFTGRHPLSLGLWASSSYTKKLPARETTIAEILRWAGYQTAAYSGGAFVTPDFGLDQGFNEFFLPAVEQAAGEKDCVQLIAQAVRWLERKRRSPFFLYIHTYAVHDPYGAPAPFQGMFTPAERGAFLPAAPDADFYKMVRRGIIELDERERAYLVGLYDEGIRYCDEQIGRLLAALDRLRLRNNTLVIVSADHGEELFDHGRQGHGDVYECIAKVPLIMRWPGKIGAGRVVSSAVRLLDVAPTILDAAGIRGGALFRHQGRSLLPHIVGKERAYPCAEVIVGMDADARLRLAVRNGAWKLIATASEPGGVIKPYRYELYDLSAADSEKNDLFAARQDVAEDLQELLTESLRLIPAVARRAPPRFPGQEEPLLDAQTMRRLKSLGYL